VNTSELQLARLKRLEYTLFAGKGRGEITYPDLHNRVYGYWKRFWSEVYGQQGSLDAFHVEDFARQDIVAVLHDREKVVALHLYSVFQLDLLFTRDHNYFKFYPENFFAFMKEKGANVTLSLEYLTVDPEWRKSKLGLSLGEVMVGCAIEVARSLEVDAVIAPARTENKVNQMGYHFGIECFQGGITKRNFTVDLTAGFVDKLHANADTTIQSLSDHYWAKRQDLTELTLRAPKTARKTA
jgi:hypothetical protein